MSAATAREFARRHGEVPGGELAIVGLGRLGGAALTHASDLDLVYLFDAPTEARSDGDKPLGATEYYNRLAARIGAAMSVATGAGPLYEVDTRLRPQGSKGLLAVRLDAFADYQRHEAWTFERMALTRARVVCGSARMRAAIEAILAEVLAPRDNQAITRDAVAMRADIAAHKPPASDWDLKLGAGGLVDLEFAVHVRQLTSGIGLTPRLGEAIAALAAAGLAPPSMQENHDLLTRALVVLRLISPHGEPPAEASRDLLAAACDAPGWQALLAAIGEARQEIGDWWQAVGKETA